MFNVIILLLMFVFIALIGWMLLTVYRMDISSMDVLQERPGFDGGKEEVDVTVDGGNRIGGRLGSFLENS